MSGKLGFARVFLFKNKNKRTPKDPDYNLFIEEQRQDQAPAAGTSQSQEPDF